MKKWTNMRDIYNKTKNKKLGSGSAANSRTSSRDEAMAFLGELVITNTRFAFITTEQIYSTISNID